MQEMYGDKEPRSVDSEPRSNYADGLKVDPVADSAKKISQVLGAYKRYRRGEKNPVINFSKFFEMWARENFADGQLVRNTVDGSRPGYKGRDYGKLPQKIKNWYKEIYPNQKFDFTKHKYGVPKENKLNRSLKSIYQYYKTVPGYFPQLISNKKMLDSIKTWFDKAIKKGAVSYTDLQNKFPAQASPTLQKALGKDFEKLTRHTPITTKIKPKILKIVDEVYANKRPLIDAAPSRLYKATYGKPYIMGRSNMGTISGVLDESDKYDKMRSKIKAAVGRVGGGTKLFETVKLKDFDKANIRTELPRTSGNLVEQNILRDLDRYISRGGKDFKYTPEGKTNDFKTLKIKDLKKGDVLTSDRIKELIKKGDTRFTEYKKVFNDMKNLKLFPYIDPVTKETTTLLQGLQKGTGIEAPLHIQHNKGILESPLKNLSIATHKANIGAKMVGSVEDVAKLGVRSTLPGGKRVYGPKLSFEDEVNRLTKFSDRMIKGAGTRTLKTPTETLKQSENFLSKIAALGGKGCSRKAAFAGGRMNFDVGGSAACISKGLERLKNPTNLSPGENANLRALKKMSTGAKGVKILGNAARVLGKLGLVSEGAIGGLLALNDYAGGSNKEEIISNFTYGLAGKSQEEQLTEQDPQYGLDRKILTDYTGLNTMGQRKDNIGRMSVKPGIEKQLIETIKKEQQPFMSGPRNEEFDMDRFYKQQEKTNQADIDYQKAKDQRALERRVDPFAQEAITEETDFMAAEGGLANLIKKYYD